MKSPTSEPGVEVRLVTVEKVLYVVNDQGRVDVVKSPIARATAKYLLELNRPQVTPELVADPLRWMRFFVSGADRETLDLIREDLAEDRAEMRNEGIGPAIVFLVVWSRSLTEVSGFFWRGLQKLLPVKLLGDLFGLVRRLWSPGG